MMSISPSQSFLSHILFLVMQTLLLLAPHVEIPSRRICLWHRLAMRAVPLRVSKVRSTVPPALAYELNQTWIKVNAIFCSTPTATFHLSKALNMSSCCVLKAACVHLFKMAPLYGQGTVAAKLGQQRHIRIRNEQKNRFKMMEMCIVFMVTACDSWWLG